MDRWIARCVTIVVVAVWLVSFGRDFVDPSYDAPASINIALGLAGISIGYDGVRGAITIRR